MQQRTQAWWDALTPRQRAQRLKQVTAAQKIGVPAMHAALAKIPKVMRSAISRKAVTTYYASLSVREKKAFFARRTAAWRQKWWNTQAWKNANAARPNQLESKVRAALQRWFPGEWAYNPGTTVINGFVPDFINVNGRKLLIEVHGDYWHRHDTLGRKRRRYAKAGFRCVFIWEREFKREPDLLRRRVERTA